MYYVNDIFSRIYYGWWWWHQLPEENLHSAPTKQVYRWRWFESHCRQLFSWRFICFIRLCLFITLFANSKHKYMVSVKPYINPDAMYVTARASPFYPRCKGSPFHPVGPPTGISHLRCSLLFFIEVLQCLQCYFCPQPTSTAISVL